MSTNITIVPVLVDKLPEFVHELYPRFVSLIKDHLTFMEQDENFLRILLDWNYNMEPSNEVDPYLDAILKDLGFESGQNLAIKKSTMLHILRDFYLSRGSEDSFKILFRALFNEPVSIHYPRDQMLVPSAAQYGERHFIFTSANNKDTIEYQTVLASIRENGGTLTGLTSNVSASIENISVVHGSGIPYLQIEILQPNFEFDVNEVATIQSGNAEFFELIKPVLEIEVVDGGFGYLESDKIQVTGPNLQGQTYVSKVSLGGVTSLTFPTLSPAVEGMTVKAYPTDSGFGFSAKVDEIDGGGVVQKYTIYNQGYNFATVPVLKVDGVVVTGASSTIGSIKKLATDYPFVDFTSCTFGIETANGTGAILNAKTVSRWTQSSWSDHKGFLGENSTLIDSDKYQQYSYTVVSSISSKNYASFVNDLLHPVGYIWSSSYEIVSHLQLGLEANNLETNVSESFLYDSLMVLPFESGFEIDTAVFIVTSDNIEIVTNQNNNIVVED